ncbi:hypothetical protein T06_2213 [Trichinella sp. T6]|nr:hypothetical protein T06_2213 [Trichinella sp. T6]
MHKCGKKLFLKYNDHNDDNSDGDGDDDDDGDGDGDNDDDDDDDDERRRDEKSMSVGCYQSSKQTSPASDFVSLLAWYYCDFNENEQKNLLKNQAP